MDATGILFQGPCSSSNKLKWKWDRKALGCLLCWSALRFRRPSPEKGVWGTRVLIWWEKPLSIHKVQLYSHHTVWGSTNCNKRGAALLEFLNATNLEVSNQSSDSTFSEYQSEEVSQSIMGLLEGLWYGVGLLALRFHHSTIHQLCISTLVARCQEKTFILRDNGNGAHYSYWCYGGTHLTTSTRFSGSGRGKISCSSTQKSVISFLLSPQ